MRRMAWPLCQACGVRVVWAARRFKQTDSSRVFEFESNHLVFVEKGNKSAEGRARKAIGEVKKLVTEYRKESVTACKSDQYK